MDIKICDSPWYVFHESNSLSAKDFSKVYSEKEKEKERTLLRGKVIGVIQYLPGSPFKTICKLLTEKGEFYVDADDLYDSVDDRLKTFNKTAEEREVVLDESRTNTDNF